jgi:hypothetical protein
MDTPKTEFNPIPSQGPVVGIIVVIIVLIFGAFYFFTRLSSMNAPELPPEATTTADTFAPTSTSDDPAMIQNDLDAEDFESIDAEMRDLDAEFGR